MINFSTEQGIVKLQSWSDIESIPGFIKDLDLDSAELESVRGNYNFPEKVNCGLSNCHTPHNKGFVVATKDGRCTNIGKDCGNKLFGIDFKILSKKFEKDLEDKENRENIYSFQLKINRLLSEISFMRKELKGADWVQSRVREFDSPDKTPAHVLKAIGDAKRDGGGRVYIDRQLSQSEAELSNATKNNQFEEQNAEPSRVKPVFIREELASLKGIDVMSKESDLRKLLILDLVENLNRLRHIDVDKTESKNLKYWAKFASEYPNKIEKVKKIVADGRLFFTYENLLPLEKFLDNLEEVTSYKSQLRLLG